MRSVKYLSIILVALLFLNQSVLALDYVTTQSATSINLSSTISVTNTFQSIQAATNNRLGCTIQNPNASGGNSMWVYFGACANATKATSFILIPAVSPAINCQTPANVLRDQVCITGTSGDTYVANFQ